MSIRRGLRTRAGLLAGLVLLAVLRLPSFWEPHWYTDEAGYSSTARAVLDGRPLYSGIWTNKPPLQIITVGVAALAGGASEPALHSLTLLAGALAVGAAWWTASRLVSAPGAAFASLVVAALLGSPLLDGELAVPESLLVAPVAWGGGLLVVWLRGRARDGVDDARGTLRRPAAAGLLLAVGVCYQQTAVADAAALGLAVALHPAGGGRALRAVAGGFAAGTAAWLIPVVLLVGPRTAGYALVGFYLSHVRTPLGVELNAAATLPSTPAGVIAHAGPPVLAVLLLCAGAVACRRLDSPVWILALWAGATLVIPAESQEPFAHFLAPAVVPCSLLAVAVLEPGWLRRLGNAPWRRRRVALGSLAMAAGLGIAATGARSAGLDWSPRLASQDSNASRDLAQYYGGALRVLAGRSPLDDWQRSFDSRVHADGAVATWINDHGLRGRSAVVWSSDAWVHLLAGLPVRLPTAPIYNDEVLLGVNGQVASAVAVIDPEVVVTADDAVAMFPEIEPLLSARYRQAYRAAPDTVWLRVDVAPYNGPDHP